MLRWAILGTSFISDIVAEAIRQSDGSEAVLIAGRNAERTAEFQNRHAIANSVLGYEAALDAADVDAVYIGLPNHKHHEIAIQAAARGKAILSEKSLTTDMPSARALIDGVRHHNAFFVEGLMYLAHPLFQRLSELLLDGRLGDIRAINGFYAADIWQVVNPEGKGTLYNLGCYPASLLQFVIQTAYGEEAFRQRTSSGAGNLLADNGNVCDAALSVRFDNGVLANLQSTDSYGMAYGFAISGTKGILRFKTNPWHPLAGRNLIEWLPYGGEPEEICVEDDHDSFYHQIRMVESCVATGLTEAPRPSPRLNDSLEIMELLTEWEAHCRG